MQNESPKTKQNLYTLQSWFPDLRSLRLTLSLHDFDDGNRDEMLFCPIRALWRYLSRTEQYRPDCKNLFVLTTRRQRAASQDTISFWLRSVISHAYGSAFHANCKAVRATAFEIQKIGTSLLFKKNYAIQQVLKVGACLSHCFYLRDIARRHMDTFISHVVAAQQSL